MTGPQFPSIPGGGQKTPQKKGRLRSVPGTGKPTAGDRVKQLVGAMRTALANPGDTEARIRFCGWYHQFVKEYPQLETAFRNAVKKLRFPR